MKILVQSYCLAFQNPAGGVKVRIKMFLNYLKKHGICAEYFNPFESKIENCDILHIFGLNHENYALIKYAKSLGKKVVLSPVIQTKSSWKPKMHRAFSRLPIATMYKYIYRSISMSDLIITETEKEKEFIKKNYRIDEERIIIIPNGAEESSDKNDLVFDKMCIPRCEYVLHIGRFDKNKNQINIIRAMKGTDIPVIFIGGQGSEDPGYFDSCIEEAAGYDNFYFLGWLEPESAILKSAYANCNTFVLPSFYETFGLSLIEAGVSGAKVVISETLPILEFKEFDSCMTFDPSDVDEIKKCILATIDKPKDEDFARRLKEAFSWDSVVDKHINCYEELLK